MLIDKIKYKKSLSDLWHKVFADSYDYIELIFKAEYEEDILCFAELDGERAVSAFYLIKNTLRFDGELYNGYYLYAAATLPEYRKSGLMSALINEAQIFCEKNGVDFITLVPSEESLYSYYSRFGFQNAMYRYEGVFNAVQDNKKEPDVGKISQAESVRQSFDGNMLFTAGHAFSYCKDCLEAADVVFLKLSKESGALLSEEEKLVLEFISSDDELIKSTDVLKDNLSCGSWVINSPFRCAFCQDSKKVRYGMLYPVSDALKRDWSYTDIYMNIALD